MVELEMTSNGIAETGPDAPRLSDMGRSGERTLRVGKGYYCPQGPDTTNFPSNNTCVTTARW